MICGCRCQLGPTGIYYVKYFVELWSADRDGVLIPTWLQVPPWRGAAVHNGAPAVAPIRVVHRYSVYRKNGTTRTVTFSVRYINYQHTGTYRTLNMKPGIANNLDNQF